MEGHARLTSADGRLTYVLHLGSNRVGRAKSACEIVLNSSRSISSKHADLQVSMNEEGALVITLADLESTNGTFVNGTHLTGRRQRPVRLQDGDVLRFGYDERSFIVNLRQPGEDAADHDVQDSISAPIESPRPMMSPIADLELPDDEEDADDGVAGHSVAPTTTSAGPTLTPARERFRVNVVPSSYQNNATAADMEEWARKIASLQQRIEQVEAVANSPRLAHAARELSKGTQNMSSRDTKAIQNLSERVSELENAAQERKRQRSPHMKQAPKRGYGSEYNQHKIYEQEEEDEEEGQQVGSEDEDEVDSISKQRTPLRQQPRSPLRQRQFASRANDHHPFSPNIQLSPIRASPTHFSKGDVDDSMRHPVNSNARFPSESAQGASPGSWSFDYGSFDRRKDASFFSNDPNEASDAAFVSEATPKPKSEKMKHRYGVKDNAWGPQALNPDDIIVDDDNEKEASEKDTTKHPIASKETMYIGVRLLGRVWRRHELSLLRNSWLQWRLLTQIVNYESQQFEFTRQHSQSMCKVYFLAWRSLARNNGIPELISPQNVPSPKSSPKRGKSSAGRNTSVHDFSTRTKNSAYDSATSNNPLSNIPKERMIDVASLWQNLANHLSQTELRHEQDKLLYLLSNLRAYQVARKESTRIYPKEHHAMHVDSSEKTQSRSQEAEHALLGELQDLTEELRISEQASALKDVNFILHKHTLSSLARALGKWKLLNRQERQKKRTELLNRFLTRITQQERVAIARSMATWKHCMINLTISRRAAAVQYLKNVATFTQERQLRRVFSKWLVHSTMVHPRIKEGSTGSVTTSQALALVNLGKIAQSQLAGAFSHWHVLAQIAKSKHNAAYQLNRMFRSHCVKLLAQGFTQWRYVALLNRTRAMGQTGLTLWSVNFVQRRYRARDIITRNFTQWRKIARQALTEKRRLVRLLYRKVRIAKLLHALHRWHQLIYMNDQSVPQQSPTQRSPYGETISSLPALLTPQLGDTDDQIFKTNQPYAASQMLHSKLPQLQEQVGKLRGALHTFPGAVEKLQQVDHQPGRDTFSDEAAVEALENDLEQLVSALEGAQDGHESDQRNIRRLETEVKELQCQCEKLKELANQVQATSLAPSLPLSLPSEKEVNHRVGVARSSQNGSTAETQSQNLENVLQSIKGMLRGIKSETSPIMESASFLQRLDAMETRILEAEKTTRSQLEALEHASQAQIKAQEQERKAIQATLESVERRSTESSCDSRRVARPQSVPPRPRPHTASSAQHESVQSQSNTNARSVRGKSQSLSPRASRKPIAASSTRVRSRSTNGQKSEVEKLRAELNKSQNRVKALEARNEKLLAKYTSRLKERPSILAPQVGTRAKKQASSSPSHNQDVAFNASSQVHEGTTTNEGTEPKSLPSPSKVKDEKQNSTEVDQVRIEEIQRSVEKARREVLDHVARQHVKYSCLRNVFGKLDRARTRRNYLRLYFREWFACAQKLRKSRQERAIAARGWAPRKMLAKTFRMWRRVPLARKVWHRLIMYRCQTSRTMQLWKAFMLWKQFEKRTVMQVEKLKQMRRLLMRRRRMVTRCLKRHMERHIRRAFDVWRSKTQILHRSGRILLFQAKQQERSLMKVIISQWQRTTKEAAQKRRKIFRYCTTRRLQRMFRHWAKETYQTKRIKRFRSHHAGRALASSFWSWRSITQWRHEKVQRLVNKQKVQTLTSAFRDWIASTQISLAQQDFMRHTILRMKRYLLKIGWRKLYEHYIGEKEIANARLQVSGKVQELAERTNRLLAKNNEFLDFGDEFFFDGGDESMPMEEVDVTSLDDSAFFLENDAGDGDLPLEDSFNNSASSVRRTLNQTPHRKDSAKSVRRVSKSAKEDPKNPENPGDGASGEVISNRFPGGVLMFPISPSKNHRKKRSKATSPKGRSLQQRLFGSKQQASSEVNNEKIKSPNENFNSTNGQSRALGTPMSQKGKNKLRFDDPKKALQSGDRLAERQQMLIESLLGHVQSLARNDEQKRRLLAAVIVPRSEGEGKATTQSRGLVIRHLQEIDELRVELDALRRLSQQQEKAAARNLRTVNKEKDKLEEELKQVQRKADRKQRVAEEHLRDAEKRLSKLNQFLLRQGAMETTNGWAGPVETNEALALLRAQVGASRKSEVKTRGRFRELAEAHMKLRQEYDILQKMYEERFQQTRLHDIIHTLKAQLGDLRARNSLDVQVKRAKDLFPLSFQTKLLTVEDAIEHLVPPDPELDSDMKIEISSIM